MRKYQKQLAVIDGVLSATDRRDVRAELVHAYIAVGGKDVATMTLADFRNSVRVAVESIDLDDELVRQRMLTLGREKRLRKKLR